MEPLISVIVPIYNVEKYLDKCIDSLVSQSYKNLEIILINDGSTDNSEDLCNKWKNTDRRIKVYNKENGGLSDARNFGMKKSHGDYISFIDSDDWIDKDYFEYLYYLCEKYDTKISICEIGRINSNGKIISKNLNNKKEIYLSKRKALIELLKAEYYSNSSSGKLFHKDIFKYREFPKGKLYEDIPVIYDIFLEGYEAVFGAKIGYFYLVREGSITSNTFSLKRLDQVYHIDQVTQRIETLYKDDNMIMDLINIRKFNVYFSVYRIIDTTNKNVYELVKKGLVETRKKIKKSNYKSKNIEKKIFLSYLKPFTINFILSIYRSN